MAVFLRVLVYFGITVAIAGFIAAVVLAHPMSAPVTDADFHRVQQLGIVKDLTLPPLSGWLITHGDGERPTIVFIHGRSSNRMQMFPLAKAFFDRGFNAVLWDLRHHGNSRGDETYGKREVPDVLRVANRIRVESQGERDRRVNPDSSGKIFANLASSKELWVVPNAGHTEAFFKGPAAYVDRVTAFFARSDHRSCLSNTTD